MHRQTPGSSPFLTPDFPCSHLFTLRSFKVSLPPIGYTLSILRRCVIIARSRWPEQMERKFLSRDQYRPSRIATSEVLARGLGELPRDSGTSSISTVSSFQRDSAFERVRDRRSLARNSRQKRPLGKEISNTRVSGIFPSPLVPPKKHLAIFLYYPRRESRPFPRINLRKFLGNPFRYVCITVGGTI